MLKKVLAAAMALGIATSAQAAGVYVQGSLGKAKADKPNYVKKEFRKRTGGSASSASSKTGYKLVVGAPVTSWLAVEGQYIDLGKHKYSMRSNQGSGRVSMDSKGFGANLVASVPIDRFTLFGKVGAQMLKTKASGTVRSGGNSWSSSKSRTRLSPSYGFGGSYALLHNLDVVAEYEQYRKVADIKNNDIRFLSAGLRYSF
mgnify:CR=1 FL=1